MSSPAASGHRDPSSEVENKRSESIKVEAAANLERLMEEQLDRAAASNEERDEDLEDDDDFPPPVEVNHADEDKAMLPDENGRGSQLQEFSPPMDQRQIEQQQSFNAPNAMQHQQQPFGSPDQQQYFSPPQQF